MALQRQARQMWGPRLQRMKAVVLRQKRVQVEGQDDGLFLDRMHRRPRLLQPGRKIGHRRPLLALGRRFRISPVALRKNPQALLTMSYCSAERLFRGGEPV